MFFNNTESNIFNQLNLCGTLYYGTEFKPILNKTYIEKEPKFSQITYLNIFYAYESKIQMKTIDCKFYGSSDAEIC